jgi:hypothetical protein
LRALNGGDAWDLRGWGILPDILRVLVAPAPRGTEKRVVISRMSLRSHKKCQRRKATNSFDP